MKRLSVALLLAFLALDSAQASDAVDAVVLRMMHDNPIPGVELEIIQDGQPIKTAAYGLANLEWQLPVTTNTVFEIGSMTKQFTAAGILLLQQQGKLSVDDKLSQYVPHTPAAWSNITLRHLLTHTSGLHNYTGLDGFELTRHLTQAQFIKRVAQEPLDFPPGNDWHYSNTGFSLLGYIIENVSGQKYWDFMQQNIFGPLGMTHTRSRDPRAIIPRRASGYETNRLGEYRNRDYDLTDIFSAGAIVSTVGDIAKWSAALDAQTLLTRDTEKEMWTPVKLNDGRMHRYGFGWFLDPLKNHVNIGHSGSTSGFSASFQRFPETHLAIIVLTNSDREGIATKLAKEIALVYLK